MGYKFTFFINMNVSVYFQLVGLFDFIRLFIYLGGQTTEQDINSENATGISF